MNGITRSIATTAIVALFHTGAIASADSAASSARNIANFLDQDSDHQISYDEFVHSMAVKAMNEMDADKDGTLSPEEAAVGAEKQGDVPSIDFSAADTNGDGKVSADELEEALRKHPGVGAMFQKHDTDQDGFLEDHELDSIEAVPFIRFHF